MQMRPEISKVSVTESRVFWLGMHKVLKPTELVRLRQLGFEVFNPPYLSPTYDQSADLRVDRDQPSTLPIDVFDRLLTYDFFYQDINEDIADILNSYFSTIIVTISPTWLKAVLKVFRGKIIYRVYGQPYSLSSHMLRHGLWEEIVSRDNFHIVPFSLESVEQEQIWFLDRCSYIVPYQIPNDVFELSGSWGKESKRVEVAVSIPNIQNPYYSAVYHSFVKDFNAPYFRIYGPQRSMPADARVLGGMSRSALLKRFSESAVYYYPYRDNVCYLPPIEMMQLGGPVIYAAGSLLSRFYSHEKLGLARTSEEADEKLKRLLISDGEFASEIIASQESVRCRYDRSFVVPIFDAVFRALLEDCVSSEKSRDELLLTLTTSECEMNDSAPKIMIPLHMDGLFHYISGKPYALEGIPRVVDAIVDSLIRNTSALIVITSTTDSRPILNDFFHDHIRANRLFIHVVGGEELVSGDLHSSNRLELVNYVNSEISLISAVFVPHYYLFPEFILCCRPMTLYLPDYFPHLLPDEVFDPTPGRDARNKQVGIAIASKAQRILTNSNFTKSYLADAGFVSEGENDKIVVAPLPFLGRKRAVIVDEDTLSVLSKRMKGKSFLFYPTANRPNKRLSFLIRVFAHLRLTRADLQLVLTCNLESYPELVQVARNFGVLQEIVALPGSSEGVMRWLYENSSALVVTSVAEGNFPPQLLEALNYGAPIVSTRLPTIVELVGPSGEGLLLCNPEELIDFADNIERAIEQRGEVLKAQQDLLNKLTAWNSEPVFATCLKKAIPVLDEQTK